MDAVLGKSPKQCWESWSKREFGSVVLSGLLSQDQKDTFEGLSFRHFLVRNYKTKPNLQDKTPNKTPSQLLLPSLRWLLLK